MSQPLPIKSPQPPKPRRGQLFFDWAQPFAEWAKQYRAVPGIGLRGRMTGDGMAFDVAPGADTAHPFKLSAEFDDPASPTVCLVSIAYGTLQGTVASGSTYSGVPLFEGSGGTRLDATTPPVYDVGVTARTNYFYFEVTTDEYGLIDEVAIVHKVAADLPLVETPYVQPDVPDDGDLGTAGVYYWLIGTVTVSEVGLVWSIAYNQGVLTSMGFYTCGSGGRFYRA